MFPIPFFTNFFPRKNFGRTPGPGQALLTLLALGRLEARLLALRGVAEEVALAIGGRGGRVVDTVEDHRNERERYIYRYRYRYKYIYKNDCKNGRSIDR